MSAANQKAALALEGGGFLSLTVQTAFTVGMLAKCKEKKMQASGVFKKFSYFSGTSGGSWFCAFLMYSESYLQMVESMAGKPDEAKNLFLERWASKIYAPEEDGLPKAELALLKLIGFHCWGGVGTSLMLVGTNNLWNFGWRSLVETLFEKSAGISPELPLGTERVNLWAKDKEFFCNHSQITPSGGLTSPLASDLDDQGTYAAKTDQTYPRYLPATFSIKVGSGSSPLPITTDAASLPGFKYRSQHRNWCQCCPTVTEAASKDAGIIDISEIHKLPLASCSASSSAYAAFIGPFPQADANASTAYPASLIGTLLESAGKILDVFKLQTWICKTEDTSAAFNEAIRLRSAMLKDEQAGLQALADKAVHSLCDGGATDVTGICWTVAAGANEVLLLHSNAQTPDAILNMFVDGPETSGVGASALGPIFAEKASNAKQQMDDFKHFESLTPGNYLKRINFGTIQTVTVANKWFGIPEGRPVTMHVLDFQTDLFIGSGPDDNFNNYGTLLDAIVSLIVDTDLGNLLSKTCGN